MLSRELLLVFIISCVTTVFSIGCISRHDSPVEAIGTEEDEYRPRSLGERGSSHDSNAQFVSFFSRGGPREIIVGEELGVPKLAYEPAWVTIALDLRKSAEESTPADVTIDYPLDESIFPPEIVPPTILWHDFTPGVDTWLVEFNFQGGQGWVGAFVPGDPPPSGEIDPRCITETNEIYTGTEYQRTAKAWTVNTEVWEIAKKASVERPARLRIIGFSARQPRQALSRGEVTFKTSRDPVGAPIFYRDVPLAPSDTKRGEIKPLSEAFLPLIAWRLRDISQPKSRLLLTGLLTCANCHSFSRDGKYLGMDVDGPAGDKGAYAIVAVDKETVIEEKDIISWNSFPGKIPGQKTIGFLSQVSPDGRYVVTTLNESVYVQNFRDYRFLQVFYPTRGILGYYDRVTRQIKPLPGADDPKYVHCDPVWTPDGKTIIFARAEAKDPYPPGYRPAAFANDPNEPQIQYSLYRIPFRDGQGGVAEPIEGASHNGMSNTFPKVSPDGKWIVFVKCRNGQLLRPDSELWIVPVEGGKARRMRCNTRLMNSWHSFSPNGRWMVFSSKVNTPYTQMFLTHIDENGQDSPPILIPNSTAANRAVNLPEFVNRPYQEFESIRVPAIEYLELGMEGIRLFEAGRLDEALVRFQRAVQKQPDYLEGHVSIGVILIEKGRWEEAIPHLEKALALDPKCWFAHANLGIVRQNQGRRHEAITHFRYAAELQPDNYMVRLNLGRALAGTGQLHEALTHLKAAIDLAPQYAPGYSDLGNVYLELGQLAEARKAYEQALRLAPQTVEARLGLAETHAQEQKYLEAMEQFNQALKQAPDDPRVLASVAMFLATCPDERFRDGVRAKELAASACRKTGENDLLCLRSLIAAHAELGEWGEAIRVVERAIQIAEEAEPSLVEELRLYRQHLEARKPIRRQQASVD
ncbi:MAG: tetratricopeptide repeat protein [Thermoguttaceae bacterium]|nr:tetratricopeptide repeat protein [Thermoguttaceae bacterium]MDW8079274.1 tetratricopeptide repeat protein [Thermoguttaceae bacterium]